MKLSKSLSIDIVKRVSCGDAPCGGKDASKTAASTNPDRQHRANPKFLLSVQKFMLRCQILFRMREGMEYDVNWVGAGVQRARGRTRDLNVGGSRRSGFSVALL